uniref:Uncharacterized protein n=1 Tax=Triticum urartu TaxID=4572 RepID=A0A8R7R872_TRIUA
MESDGRRRCWARFSVVDTLEVVNELAPGTDGISTSGGGWSSDIRCACGGVATGTPSMVDLAGGGAGSRRPSGRGTPGTHRRPWPGCAWSSTGAPSRGRARAPASPAGGLGRRPGDSPTPERRAPCRRRCGAGAPWPPSMACLGLEIGKVGEQIELELL